MTRATKKGQRFEFLVGRAYEAIDCGFYVEAESLLYALFEERTYALLDLLSIQYDERYDKLSHCLNKFTKAVINRTITVSPSKGTQDDLYRLLQYDFLDSNLVQNIQQWRHKRNIVIHDLAKLEQDGNESQNYYNTELKDFALKGKEYFSEYSAAIMRLKKMF